jgi:hypothetical protein
MSSDQQIIERITTVHDEPVKLYSFDGWRWFSDRAEAEQAQQRHEKMLARMKAYLKKSATFRFGEQVIGRRSKRRIAAEKKYATQID